jgi:hypothetical protein
MKISTIQRLGSPFGSLMRKSDKRKSEAEIDAEVVESKPRAPDQDQNQKEQTTKAKGFLSKHRAVLQSAIIGAALVVAEEKLSDEQVIREIFNRFTEALPRPIRFLFPRETVFRYLMNRKVQLINSLKGTTLPIEMTPPTSDPAAGGRDDSHQNSIMDAVDNLLLEGPAVEPGEARLLPQTSQLECKPNGP